MGQDKMQYDREQWRNSMESRYCVQNKMWSGIIATKNVKLKCWWEEFGACVCVQEMI